MRKPLIINKERTVNAAPDQIWEIITTPDYFDEWMFVPGQVSGGRRLQLGSKIQWINDNDIVYLEGEVIEFVPNKKLVISLHDISWTTTVPKGTVTYEFHLIPTDNGTKIKFYLGDLSIDPESEAWYKAYNSSDEIGAIEKVVLAG